VPSIGSPTLNSQEVINYLSLPED
jgi:ribosomal protein L44E